MKLHTPVYNDTSGSQHALPALVEGFEWVFMGDELHLYGPDNALLGTTLASKGQAVLVDLARRHNAYCLQGLKECRETLTPWIPDPHEGGEYSCLRALEGTDPSDPVNRRAFIEKSARVCVNGMWVTVHDGKGGSEDPSTHGLYGYDLESRRAADLALVDLGYTLS